MMDSGLKPGVSSFLCRRKSIHLQAKKPWGLLLQKINAYEELLSKFGEPSKYWPQWCAKNKSISEREKIVIGMILVQRTTWHNANIALKNLKREALLSLHKIANLIDADKLTKLIRPAGFFQSKPKRLIDICSFVEQEGGIKIMLKKDAKELRSKLLNIKGVGRETADTILLYALDKPYFIIDEYTRRWANKMGFKGLKDYDEFQSFFQEELEQNVELYQKLHALIIISQKGKEKSMMEIV